MPVPSNNTYPFDRAKKVIESDEQPLQSEQLKAQMKGGSSRAAKSLRWSVK